MSGELRPTGPRTDEAGDGLPSVGRFARSAVRGRIEARAWHLHDAIQVPNELIGGRDGLVPVDAPDCALTPEQRRQLGVDHLRRSPIPLTAT